MTITLKLTEKQGAVATIALREYEEKHLSSNVPFEASLARDCSALADIVEFANFDTVTDTGDEPHGSHDMSDDGDALASAGHGTDEDYGGSHGGVE